MFTFKKHLGGVLILGTLLILGPGSVPVRADGMGRLTVQGSDRLQFAEELQTNGALKFYENTENVLRSGRFERAFSRYLFLKAHIRGQSLEAGLAAMVDQRLHFLGRN